MNRWNLDALYASFEDPAYARDLALLKEKHEALSACRLETSEKALEMYLTMSLEIEALSEKLYMYPTLVLAANTADDKALKATDQINELLASFVSEDVQNEKWIATFDLETCQSPLIKEHLYILKEIQENQKHTLDEKSESLIAHMKNTGSYAWAKYKDQLVSSIKITIDGKEMPLTEALNQAYSPDKETRKKAYFAEVNGYKDSEQGIAASLNAIKGEVLYTTKLRGYDSVLDMTCEQSRLSRKTLDTLLDVMKANMDVFRDYLQAKAHALGYSKGLPWYELYAPVVKDESTYSYEQGCDFVKKHFSSFSLHMGAYATRAINEHWIDIYPRVGKVGGAFCENIMSLKESRFLLNYGDHFSDMITMAHELGHGFHGECLKDESLLNTSYPMPIAETASTFCETIVTQAALKEADDQQKLAILENSLCDATQVIVDIYSRFLFESHFFDKRKEGALSVEEIKTLMLEAQKEAYGYGMDEDYLHPYMWTWKPHYYDPDYSFYNFPYAFGLLLAKGLYHLYQQEGSSFAKTYEYFLSLTGKEDLEDVAKSVGIDLRDPAFWQGSIDVLKEDVLRFKELLNK